VGGGALGEQSGEGALLAAQGGFGAGQNLAARHHALLQRLVALHLLRLPPLLRVDLSLRGCARAAARAILLSGGRRSRAQAAREYSRVLRFPTDIACGLCGCNLELARHGFEECPASAHFQFLGFLDGSAEGTFFLLSPLRLPLPLFICSFRFFLCSFEGFVILLLQLDGATISFLLGRSQGFHEIIIIISTADSSRCNWLLRCRLRCCWCWLRSRIWNRINWRHVAEDFGELVA
jgi:hypothetical protein